MMQTTRLARWLLMGFVAAMAAMAMAPASAQAQGAGIGVTEIRVEGAQRIEPDTVRSYVSIQIGDAVDAVALDRSLKKLFATGLFADVVVRQEGSVVAIRVVENPIINRIAFEGNRLIEDQHLEDEVKLRPRIVFTRSRVRGDVQRIIDLYRRSGRFAATVEPKVIQLPQNRVDLVFEINEGPLTEIRRIAFLGNSEFKDSRLRQVIQTRESAWYRFLTTDDSYDPDRLTFDRELLRRFYLANGYADFRVVSAVAELATDRKGFFITFTIEEGERYKFGKLDVETALRDLKAQSLRSVLAIEEGDWYDANAVESIIGKLTNAVGNLGYAFVDIRPRVKRNRKTRTIGVSFNVQEGPRVFVERIDITGNVRTTDPVIRREFTLVEGDAFNSAKLRRSRRRIRNLGFFDKVDVNNVPGSAPDKTVVTVGVREKSTGEISFGAGFSSTSGILGDIRIRERNLLGRGHDLFLRLQLAQRATEIELRFTEPYFLERRLSAGFDLFSTGLDLQDESSYDRKSTGFGLRLGYSLTEKLNQNLSYRLSRDEVTDVASDASISIKEQEGSSITSSLGQTLSYDVRDNRFNPTEGFLARWQARLAGLGGSVHYIQNRVSGVQYYPIGADFIGSLRGSSGIVFGINDDVRLIDRFSLGGTSLRGFANSGVGPRDVAADDALGGNWFYNGSLEMSFPLGLPDEIGIRGRIFTEAGSIGDLDQEGANVTDTSSLRASAGFGLSWRSPLGPISIDIAKAILKEDFDKTETIRFNFGTRF